MSSAASAAPAAPVVSQPSTGNFWVLHSWAPGTDGDTTDGYRIYYDDSWHDTTETSFTHTLNPHATSTIIIVAYNASTDTTSSEVTSTAQIPNNRISITGVSSTYSVSVGETVNVDAGFIDADDDIPTFSCSDTDKFSDFNADTGEGSWTPDTAGTYSVDFGVSDYASSDTQTMTINVESTDSAPVLKSIGDKSVREGELLEFTVVATDEDGDKPTYSATGLPDGASIKSNTGVFSWTPDYRDEGNYDITFTATANGASDSESITITVTGDNAPVLTTIGNKNAVVDHPLEFTIVATDADNDPIVYSATRLPTGATLDSTSGDFSWTPTSSGYSTTIYFTATANGQSDTESVRITVVDDSAPVLSSIGDKSVDEGSLLRFTIYALDPDDDTPVYSATDMPDGSTLDSSTGVFSWTPTYNSSGKHSVTFVATSRDLSDSEVIVITVNNVDTPPVLAPINNKAVDENHLLSFTISATDSDGDEITYSANDLPDGATFNSTNATFSWIPSYNSSGNYAVEFIATSNDLSDSESITITVGDYNRPPELSSIGSKTIEEGSNLTITLSATDPDSDNITYSAQNLPGNSTFNESTAVFSWTPEDEGAGTYYALFLVSDGELDDSENVTITVTEPSTNSGSSGGGSSSSSSSSSGGGGGGGASGEKYENIGFKDYVLKTSVLRNDDVVFAFEKPENSITAVSFTPNVNGGKSKAVVEILQDTSSQVNSDAPGDVYKNVNIYLDTSLVPAAIDDVKISFEVEKSWVTKNNVNISHIVLCRYTSSKWELLPTEMTEEDSEYLYFTSESPGFSSFAISSVDPASLVEPVPKSTIKIPQSDEGVLASTVDSLEELGPSQKSVSAFGFVLILIIAGLGIIYWAVKME